MNTSEDTTISIVLHCLLDACGPPRNDLLNACHITAQLHIDVIAAIPQADDGSRRAAERGVRAQIVLVVGRRIEEGRPLRIDEACVGR